MFSYFSYGHADFLPMGAMAESQLPKYATGQHNNVAEKRKMRITSKIHNKINANALLHFSIFSGDLIGCGLLLPPEVVFCGV